VNSQQAKEILVLFRPGTADERDPEFVEALELAAQDPELQSWFREHGAMQQFLRDRFRQIPVPEGLKQQIISERKAHSRTELLRRRPALVAVSASLLLLLVVFAQFYARLGQTDRFSDFRNRMARIVLREYPKMDLETADLTAIRKFLEQKKAPGDYSLPNGLAQAKGTGCAILDWRGQPVSMICFDSGKKADPNDASDVFLFIIDRKSVPRAPASKPRFSQLNRLATLSWTAGDKTYVLGGFGDEAFIRRFL
jgi:hypothetical protein